MNLLLPKPNPDLENIHWIRYVPASKDSLEKCAGMGMSEIRGAIHEATSDFMKLTGEKGENHPDTLVVASVLHAAMAVFHQYKHHN